MIVAGCSSASEPPDYAPAHALLAERLLTEADTSVIHESQLDVIASVAEDGRDVTFEEYSAAVYATTDCLIEMGFAIDGPWSSAYNGQQLLEFGYSPPAGYDDALTTAAYAQCSTTFLSAVEHLYQTNPRSSEYVDEAFDRARPAIVECVASYGFEVPSDGTIAEIAPVVIEVRDLYGDDADCYERSGFQAALNN